MLYSCKTVVKWDAARLKKRPIIIVADKDKRTRKSIQRFLGIRRQVIKTTTSDVELVRQLIIDEPSLIFLDAFLSATKVFDLIPILKQIRPETPIVVMTDESIPSLEMRVGQQGIFYYLLKPVEKEEIKAVAEDALASMRVRDSSIMGNTEYW